MNCDSDCGDFKGKISCFDELRYAYVVWYREKNKKNWDIFMSICYEHLFLPEEASIEWLRELTGR